MMIAKAPSEPEICHGLDLRIVYHQAIHYEFLGKVGEMNRRLRKRYMYQKPAFVTKSITKQSIMNSCGKNIHRIKL